MTTPESWYPVKRSPHCITSEKKSRESAGSLLIIVALLLILKLYFNIMVFWVVISFPDRQRIK